MIQRKLLKEYVRMTLVEGYSDIVEIMIRIRVKITGKHSPMLLDVLTDIRGIQNVITVKQIGELGRINIDGQQFALLSIKFEDDDEYGVPELYDALKKIQGIDIIKILTYEGQPYEKIAQAQEKKPALPTLRHKGKHPDGRQH
jgi:hypothetical protein